MNKEELVTIPKEVGEFITHQKAKGKNFFTSLENLKYELEILMWITKDDNEDKFLSAWVNGFNVELETLYQVRFKGLKKLKDGYDYLNYNKKQDEWLFMSKHEVGEFRTKHTRKELEEAGFGEVFTSKLFEVKELEDE
jgi:phage protein